MLKIPESLGRIVSETKVQVPDKKYKSDNRVDETETCESMSENITENMQKL